jgi:hypothetical protein
MSRLQNFWEYIQVFSVLVACFLVYLCFQCCRKGKVRFRNFINDCAVICREEILIAAFECREPFIGKLNKHTKFD